MLKRGMEMAQQRRRRTTIIVIHCSATQGGQDIGLDEITAMHKRRGFDTIGYHELILLNGDIEFGRHPDAVGAHVKGQNYRSIGICLVGGVDAQGNAENNFTPEQFASLHATIQHKIKAYPRAVVVGHRDLSPDLNGDGIIQHDEFIKECPCFSVYEFLEQYGLEQFGSKVAIL